MTKAELHNTPGFHPPTLAALAIYLRRHIPRKKGMSDPTSIVQRDGETQGFLDCIEEIEGITSPDKEKLKPGQTTLYGAPQFPEPPKQ